MKTDLRPPPPETDRQRGTCRRKREEQVYGQEHVRTGISEQHIQNKQAKTHARAHTCSHRGMHACMYACTMTQINMVVQWGPQKRRGRGAGRTERRPMRFCRRASTTQAAHAGRAVCRGGQPAACRHAVGGGGRASARTSGCNPGEGGGAAVPASALARAQ